MRSKIIKILLFLFIGLECLAITNRERIEKDLRKLNITDSTMIAQTINIDEKLGDKFRRQHLIDDFIYVRSGKDRTWGLEKPLFGGDTRPDNAVTYNESGHIVAGDIEMWIGEE